MKCLFYCLTVLCLLLSNSYVTLFSELVFTLLDSLVCTVFSGPRLISYQASPAGCQGMLAEFFNSCSQKLGGPLPPLSPDPVLPASCELNSWPLSWTRALQRSGVAPALGSAVYFFVNYYPWVVILLRRHMGKNYLLNFSRAAKTSTYKCCFHMQYVPVFRKEELPERMGLVQVAQWPHSATRNRIHPSLPWILVLSS